MESDKDGDDDHLAAEERLLSGAIRELLQAMFCGFETPTIITSQLVSEPKSEFRRVRCRIECLQESLESVQGVCSKELSVLARDDNAEERSIRLLCSISPIVTKQTSLPSNYPQSFHIDIVVNDKIEKLLENEGVGDQRLDDSIPSDLDNTDITLLLSGGGFRATLFHLGVVRHLREVGKLKNVKEVFSVSGGSILAAHMAVNFGAYTGTEKQFDKAASELVSFIKRGLREEIIRKYLLVWLLPALGIAAWATYLWCFFEYGLLSIFMAALWLTGCLMLFIFLEIRLRPICSLRSGYRQLFGLRTMANLDAASTRFFFLATNLTTGNIGCFTNNGVWHDIDESKARSEQLFSPTKAIQLAECVAASSAFPPLFSPVAIDLKKLKVDVRTAQGTHYFTDGGVYDNLGVRACRLLATNRRTVIVSDAERKFDWSTSSNFRWLLGRASRATDVLMHRVNNLEFDSIAQQSRSQEHLSNIFGNVTFARLQTDHDEASYPNGLSADLQRRARRIRTDLDAFSEIEIQVLYAAGYQAVSAANVAGGPIGTNLIFAESGLPIGATEKGWLPVKHIPALTMEAVLNQLDSSEHPNRKLLSLRSFNAWVLIFIFGALLAINPITVSMTKQLLYSSKMGENRLTGLLLSREEIASRRELAKRLIAQKIPENHPEVENGDTGFSSIEKANELKLLAIACALLGDAENARDLMKATDSSSIDGLTTTFSLDVCVIEGLLINPNFNDVLGTGIEYDSRGDIAQAKRVIYESSRYTFQSREFSFHDVEEHLITAPLDELRYFNTICAGLMTDEKDKLLLHIKRRIESQNVKNELKFSMHRALCLDLKSCRDNVNFWANTSNSPHFVRPFALNSESESVDEIIAMQNSFHRIPATFLAANNYLDIGKKELAMRLAESLYQMHLSDKDKSNLSGARCSGRFLFPTPLDLVDMIQNQYGKSIGRIDTTQVSQFLFGRLEKEDWAREINGGELSAAFIVGLLADCNRLRN